jgi:hypothetical protein
MNSWEHMEFTGKANVLGEMLIVLGAEWALLDRCIGLPIEDNY